MRVQFAAAVLTLMVVVILGTMVVDVIGLRFAPAVRVYQEGKAPSAEAVKDSAQQSLTWQLPDHWRQVANPDAGDGMIRMDWLGTFAVALEDGSEVTVQMSRWPSGMGDLAANVNRWRGQVGLEELPAEAAVASLTAATSPAGAVNWVALANDDSGALAAILTVDSGWIAVIKLMLPAKSVRAIQPGFVAFCRSLTLAGGTSAATQAVEPAGPKSGPKPAAPRSATAAGQTALSWQLPASWRQVANPAAGGGMIRMDWLGTFVVTLADGGQATVQMSRWPSGMGDLAANVNRWRGQVGLEPLAPAAATASLTAATSPAGAINWVALAKGDQGALAAILTVDSGWVAVIKLLLPAKAVPTVKPGFIAFCRSLTLAGATGTEGQP